jgi:hypothetical protein
VLAQLKDVFLNPAALGALLMRELEEHRKTPEECAAQSREPASRISKLDGELNRLADAIASGAAPATLLEAITAREAERRDLRAKLEHLNGLAIDAGEFGVVAWLEETKELLDDIRATWKRTPPTGGRYYGDFWSVRSGSPRGWRPARWSSTSPARAATVSSMRPGRRCAR